MRNTKRREDVYSHTPPDAKKIKLEEKALKDDKKNIAKNQVKILREMARGESHEDAKNTAKDEIEAEARTEKNREKKTNRFDVLVGQGDDDEIGTMATQIESFIDELAKEREQMKENIKLLMAERQERMETMEKMALRQIYHAFNEKCLHMIAQNLGMKTSDFFSVYSIRNIGDLNDPTILKEELPKTIGTIRINDAWGHIQQQHAIPLDSKSVWDAIRKTKRPLDEYIHGSAFTKLVGDDLIEAAKKHIINEEELDFFMKILKWSKSLSRALGKSYSEDSIYY